MYDIIGTREEWSREELIRERNTLVTLSRVEWSGVEWSEGYCSRVKFSLKSRA